MNINVALKELKIDRKLLESHCIQTEVGLEAIDPKVFLTYLRKLTTNSSKLVKFILNQRDVTIEYFSESKFALDKRVLKTPFTVSGRNILYSPIGFTGYFLDFTEFLTEHKKDMLNTGQALVDANKIFSTYIVNPELLSKLDHTRVPVLEKVGKLPKEMGVFFSGKDGNDRSLMETIYTSYGNYSQVSKEVESLTLDFKNIKLSGIKKNIDEFYETLNLINTKLQASDVVISKPSAKAMGGLIYNMADWIALYSLYLSKLSSLTLAHHDNCKKLNSFF